MLLSQLEALHDFQNLSSLFRKRRFLKNIINILSPQKFQLFSLFQSDAPRYLHACNELVENSVKELCFPKNAFSHFFAKKNLSISK